MQVYFNGKADPTAPDAVQIVYVDRVIWVKDTQGLWRSKVHPTAQWFPPNGTTLSPLVGDGVDPTPTESPNGTQIIAWTDPAIISASGDSWSLSPVENGQVVINGINDQTTKDIKLILYKDGLIYIRNAYGLWWVRSRAAGGAWVEVTDPTGTPVHAESAHGTIITAPANTPIWNQTGDKFTLTAVGGRVAINDIADTTTTNVVLIGYYNHAVYYKNGAGSWWVKPFTQSAWVPTSDPAPPVLPNTVRGLASVGPVRLISSAVTSNQGIIAAGRAGPVRATGAITNPVGASAAVRVGILSAFGAMQNQASNTGRGTIGRVTASIGMRFQESVQGARYNDPSDAPIVNQTGDVFTFAGPDGRVYINGVADPTGFDVIEIVYWNRQVFVKNNHTPTEWWVKATTTSPWTAASDPNPSSGTVTHVTVQAKLAAAIEKVRVLRANIALIGGGTTPGTYQAVGRATIGPVRLQGAASAGSSQTVNRVVAPLVGTVTAGTYKHGRIANQDYGWIEPAQYDPSKAYPLLMFLHWNGHAYTWYDAGVDSVYTEAVNGYFNNVNFRRNYPCFLLVPYCDQRADNQGGAQINWGGYTKPDQFSEGANMALLEDFLSRYPIDRTRIYVTGTSLGGHGTLGHMIKYGARGGQKTTRRYFTAGAPMDGWSIEYFPSDNALKEQLRNEPMWAWAGNQDGSASPFWRQWYQAYGGGGSGSAGTGEFRTTGGKIYDPEGRMYIARGPNGYVTRDGITWAKIKALWPATNMVRLPCETFVSAATFDTFVNAATADKCVVMIEYHPWPLVAPHTGTALTNVTNWYASVANRFKNNPYVWFNTPNEPQSSSGSAISTEHRAVYDAIRGTGARNFILMEAGRGGGDPGAVGKGFLIDSQYANMFNVGIDLHSYGWMTSYSTNITTIRNTLLGAANTQTGILACKAMVSADGNMPVVIGEFGASTTASQRDANWQQHTDTVMNWAVQQGYTSGWCAWCWLADQYNQLQNNNGASRTDWGDIMNNGANATKTYADQQPPAPGTGTGGYTTGAKAPSGQLRYKEVSGGHGAGWGQAYAIGSSGNETFTWLFSQIYGDTPTTPPNPPANESAEGTSVTTVGPAVVNSAGQSFTITSGAQIAVNGVVDSTTANATRIYYSNHRVYHQNASGDWYVKTLASDPWEGPVTSPVPVVQPPAGSVREPWDQPGSNNSVWNTPIGSGVQWSAENDADCVEIRSMGCTVNSANYGQPWYIGEASDALVHFRCLSEDSATPYLEVDLHLPAGWTPAAGIDRHVSVADKTKARYTYGFYDVNPGNGEYVAYAGERVDAYSTMEDADLGLIGWHAGIGAIREYDLNRGRIEHVLRFACDKGQMRVAPGGAYNVNVPWPNARLDFGAQNPNDFNYYTGYAFIAGSTIGIPWSTPMPSGMSAGGQMLFRALKEFGAIWRDQGGGGVIFYAEPKLSTHPLIQGMTADCGKIKPLLRVMRNQSRTTKNGGGTFLSAAPPPINPAYAP